MDKAKIEFTKEEADTLIRCIDVTLRQEGISAAAKALQLVSKIQTAFAIEEKK